MTIDIVFIGTDKYIDFLPSFYKSVSVNFCTECNKKFHIFTDSNHITLQDYNNSFIHNIKHEKWPYITLKRFEFINQHLSSFKGDYCFFIDSDMEVVKPFKFSDLKLTKKYIGVMHPGQLTGGLDYYKNTSLEKDIMSAAYFDPSTLKTYFQGCIWGGTREGFSKIITTLSNAVREDTAKDIVAIWHDETHLNKFFNENYDDVDILHSQFAYPEKWQLNCTPVIIHKDKDSSTFKRFSGK
jgi:hypothetical protein